MVEQWLWQQWQQRGWFAALMFPVSLLYGRLAAWHRQSRTALRRDTHLPVKAIIVVGNLTVGGNGKTPMTIWLALRLKGEGFRPGIISRGYGRRHAQQSTLVKPGADPDEVGDEPLLLARNTRVPVWVDRDRVRAALALAERGVDIIIADDGFQHHRLPRDIAIVMVDGQRRFGNELCLPAGPLREPIDALAEADFIVVNEGDTWPGEYAMRLVTADHARNLQDPKKRQRITAWSGSPVHAVAGIANPERFFLALEAIGISVIRHPFPDHYRFRPQDIMFNDPYPVLMTEKDAVKCARFASLQHWYWPVVARPEPQFEQALIRRLQTCLRLNYLG